MILFNYTVRACADIVKDKGVDKEGFLLKVKLSLWLPAVLQVRPRRPIWNGNSDSQQKLGQHFLKVQDRWRCSHQPKQQRWTCCRQKRKKQEKKLKILFSIPLNLVLHFEYFQWTFLVLHWVRQELCRKYSSSMRFSHWPDIRYDCKIRRKYRFLFPALESSFSSKTGTYIGICFSHWNVEKIQRSLRTEMGVEQRLHTPYRSSMPKF